MESQQTDDWFDKLMLFLANSAKPITEEWFKISGWFLVLAAFSFLSHVTEQIIYKIVLGVSTLLLWLYLMFHYQKVWYHTFDDLADRRKQWGFWKCLAINSIGILVTLLLAIGMLFLAAFFADDASKYLHTAHK